MEYKVDRGYCEFHDFDQTKTPEWAKFQEELKQLDLFSKEYYASMMELSVRYNAIRDEKYMIPVILITVPPHYSLGDEAEMAICRDCLLKLAEELGGSFQTEDLT